MKKTKLLGKPTVIIFIIAILCFTAIFTACNFINGGDDDNTEITFDNIVFKDGNKTIEVDGHPIPSNFIPEKEGYEFRYWITDLGNKNSVFDQNAYDGKPLTLYAVWKAKKYKVTFVDYDGTIIKVDGEESQTVDYDTAAKAPKDPERYGYTFTGWDVSFSQIKTDTTVTATYERTATTVSFYYENQLLAQKQLYIGEKIDVCIQEALDGLVGFTSAGLEVEGWYSDSALTDKITISSATATENMNVYAKLQVAHNKTLSVSTDREDNSFEYSEDLTVGVTLNYTEYASIAYSIKWYVDGELYSSSAKVLSLEGLTVGAHVVKAVVTSSFDGLSVDDEKSVTVAINKATLTVKPDDLTIGYGDSFPITSYSVKNANGVVLGTANVITDYKAGDAVGKYKITVTDFESDVYKLVFQDGTLTVVPKVITVKAVDKTVEYGSSAPAFEYLPSAIVGNDDLGKATFECSYAAGSSVGEYAIKVSGLSNPNYTVSEYEDGVLTVEKMELAFKVVYENVSYGDDQPEFSYRITKGEILAGDSLGTARFTTNYEKGNDVGRYWVRMNGLKNSNYDIPATTTAYFQVLPKSVQLDWMYSESYTYDGNDQSGTVSASFVDVEGVTVSVDLIFGGASEIFKNAGEYSVTATIDNDNYKLTNGILTLKIAKKQASVTVDNLSIVYGDEVPEYGYSIDGVCGDDSLGNIEFVCDYRKGSNAGQYSLIAKGLANDNYEIVCTDALLTVEKRAVEVNWQMNDSYEYTGTIQSDTIYAKFARYDGKYTTLVLSYKLNDVVSDFKNAGTYTVVAETKDENYLLSDTEKSITINPKDVRIVFASDEITFGDDAPVFSHEIQGLVSGETPSILGKLSYVCDYRKGSNAGTYSIGGKDLENPNYNVIYDNGNLIVNKLSVEAIWSYSDSYVYNGGSQAASVTCKFMQYTGEYEEASVRFVSGSYNDFYHAGDYVVTAASPLEINYDITNKNLSLSIAKKSANVIADDFDLIYGDSVPVYTSKIEGLYEGDSLGNVVYTCDYRVGSPVNDYVIAVSGCFNDDYEISYAEARVKCNYRQVRIDWSYADGYVYSKTDQSDTVKATFIAYDGETIVADLIFDCNGENVFMNAGNYVVTALTDNKNYVLLNNENELSIQPKAAVITVGNASATYGDANVDFEVIVDGVIEGDTIENTLSFVYTQGLTTVGSYELSVDFVENSNYAVTVQKGSLVVNKKDVSVVWQIANLVYDGTDRSDSVKATFLSYDGKQIEMSVAFDGVSKIFKNAGEYALTATSENENYEYRDTTRIATIAKKTLSINVDSKTIEYGDEISFSYVADGLIAGDSLGDYSFVCDYSVGSPVDEYAIILQNATNDNYEITINNSVLTVNPKVVTLSWIYDSFTYDGTDRSASVKCVYKNYLGNTVEMPLTITGDYSEFKNAGNYTFTATNNDSNYSVEGNFVQMLSIAKANYDGIIHNALEGTYNPDKHLSDYGLSDNFVWQNGDFVPTVDVTEYAAVYNADKTNYNDYNLTIVLTLAKATHTNVAEPNAMNGVYDPAKNLTYYALADNYFWNNPETIPTVNVTSYGAYYNTDRVNYEDYDLSVTINLSKATFVGITHDALKGTYNPDKRLSDYVLSDNFAWQNGDVVPTVNVSRYAATYNADSVNYEDFDLTIELDLAKADYVGITHDAFNGTYNPDKHLSDYVLSDNFVWQNGDIVPTVNVTNYAAIYNTDSVNYNDYVLTVSVNLTKAVYTSAPVQSDLSGVYNPSKPLSQYALSTGFRWSNSSEVPVVQKTVYNAYYNVDSVNYEDFATTITLKLTKATVSLTQTVWAFDYNESGFSITPTVSYNGSTLGASDYSLSYTNGNKFTVGGVYTTTVNLSSQNYQMIATECTVKIKSVITSASSTLTTLEDALSSTTSGTVIVKYPTRLNNEAEVKSGVTLLVPYSDAHDATLVPSDTSSANLGSAYMTLTISKDVELIVKGTLNVSGRQYGTSGQYPGHTCGNYGQLILEDNAFVDVYGKLYASGYVTGSGEVYINASAEAHELLAIKDWAGGSVAYSVYDDYFPFTQYAISNVEAKMTVGYNAKLLAHYYLIASDKDFKGQITMFGSGGLFEITDSVNGSIEKQVDTATGKIKITSHGAIKTNNISLKISVSIASVTMTTSGKQMPICGYYDVVIGSGSVVTISSGFRFLPGSSLTVEQGGTCDISSSGGIIAYNSAYTNVYTGNVSRAYGGQMTANYTRLKKTVYNSSSAVNVVINGTMTVSGSFGGNVTTTVAGSKLNTSSGTVSGQIISYCEIGSKTFLKHKVTTVNYSYSVISNGTTLGKGNYTGNASGYFA